MLNVTEEQRTAFKTTSLDSQLRVYFPNLNLNVGNDQIESETMKLTESLIAGTNIEFVGCISSQFEIKLYDVAQDLKNQAIHVYINRDETGEIPLFRGIVDSVEMQPTKSYKTIKCYDALYTKGQIDIASWYNSLSFPITLKNFRNSLFSYIGLAQQVTNLPNDDISIIKQYEPKTLQCLPVLKYLCQINGCFGIINRSGIFEYRFINNAYEPIYPAVNLFPSPSLFPVSGDEQSQGIADDFAYYRDIKYQEYFVNPVQRLQIRQSDDEAGVTVGNPSGNKYIIQNNMFTYGQDDATLRIMAKRIWGKIANISFHPCNTDNTGLPYVEVGDVVSYTLPNMNRRSRSSNGGSYLANKFNVMSRELKGIQALKDNYVAKGEQDQSEFITDIQAQLETIKRNGVNMDDYYTKEEIDYTLENDYWDIDQTQEAVTEITDLQLSEMEAPTGFDVMSVYTLPSVRYANTLYLVQGGIVVIN